MKCNLTKPSLSLPDTAAVYQNEKDLGEALAYHLPKFGLTRKEMIAVTDVFRVYEVGLRAGADEKNKHCWGGGGEG